MKVLGCSVQKSEVWSVPIYWLNPIHEVDPDVTAPPELFEDLDENGMKHPLIAWPMSYADWHRWCRDRPHVTGSLAPKEWAGYRDGGHVMHDYKRGTPDEAVRTLGEMGLIWCVHTGSQRLLWARLRGYTQIPTVLCATFEACEKAKARLYRA